MTDIKLPTNTNERVVADEWKEKEVTQLALIVITS
jgi:hypothetical protein